MTIQKWCVKVTLVIGEEFKLETIALLDSGADSNCIQEGLIPTKYFEKIREKLNAANGSKLKIKYKLSDAYICNQEICLKTSFILVKNLNQSMILGTFLNLIKPFSVDDQGVTTQIYGQNITFQFISPPYSKDSNSLKIQTVNQVNLKQKQLESLKDELNQKRIKEKLETPTIKGTIRRIKTQLQKTISSELPNAFWNRKCHSINLSCDRDFNERKIPTKARPI